MSYFEEEMLAIQVRKSFLQASSKVWQDWDALKDGLPADFAPLWRKKKKNKKGNPSESTFLKLLIL